MYKYFPVWGITFLDFKDNEIRYSYSLYLLREMCNLDACLPPNYISWLDEPHIVERHEITRFTLLHKDKRGERRIRRSGEW